MKAIRLQVYGLVQGVGFRYATRQKALSLGLRGAVWNRDDGAVEIIGNGETERMLEFIEWCQHGPPTARVDKLEYEDIDPFDAETFEIKRK